MAKRFRSTRLPRRQSSPAFPGRLRQEQQRRIDGSDSPLTHSRAPTGYLDDSRLPPPHEDLRNGLREGDHIFFLEAIRGVDSRERRQVLEHVHRSEEHTSELQSHSDLVCRLLLEKKKKKQ